MVLTTSKTFLFTIVTLLFTIASGNRVLRFSIEPHNEIVSEGNSVTLPCEGELIDSKGNNGTAKRKSHAKRLDLLPNIQWRGPGGQDIGVVGDTFRMQLENGSLYISSVEENRGLTGPYQCLLSSDGIGAIVSRSAVVSVAKIPETNNIFSPMDLAPGQTAYFKCFNSSSQSPNIANYRIQWFKDNDALHIDNTRMTFFPSGALEIDDLMTADKGSYYCNITSGSFYKVSSKVYLNIKSGGEPQTFQAPHFLTETTSKTLVEGTEAILECVANGNPKPQIQWLLNGEDINTSSNDSRYRIAGTGSLQILSAVDEDTGNYQCRASNSIDSSDIQVSIQVQVPPSFVRKPADRIASEKDEIELACDARAKPTPIVQWLKNGDVITPNDYMQIVNGHNLRILGLLESDAGMFQCIATNPAGSIQAAARLQINVQRKTVKSVRNKKKNESPKAGRPIIEVAADSPAYHPLPIARSKDFLESLRPNGEDRSELNSEDYDYSTSNEDETIPHFGQDTNPNKRLNTFHQHKLENNFQNEEHSKIIPLFTDNSKNSDGNVAIKALLPGPPRDLLAQIVNPRFVALTWLEPTINPDEVISYTVYYKMSPSNRERKITTKSRDEQMANIQSLMPGKAYQFRVVGNSHHGPGASSKVFEVKTQSEKNIAGPCQNVEGRTLSHKEIHVKWSPPLVTNGNITKYRVYYTMPEMAENFIEQTDLEAVLTELRPYTEYTIYVIPFNENGMGDPSDEIIAKTFSSTPDDIPHNTTLEATSSTSILVRWEPPSAEMQNGQITGYKIRYRKHKKQVQVETTPANVRHYELRDLEKKSTYQVKIAAMTVNGTGPFSEWNSIETFEYDLSETHVPGKPAWLQARASSKFILIKWGPPEVQDIKVRHYILGYGVGIPDLETVVLDEKLRHYEIKDVEPNEEYVLALRAHNTIGDGEPQYANVATRDEDPIESGSGIVLEVPVRLRAITMSSNSIVVYWTDNSVSRSPHTISNKFYRVRYNPVDSNRYKYYNTTDLNCMIDDLRPSMQYEFAVKAVKGRRESAWSMSEVNTTFPLSQVSPPRDLTVLPDPKNPQKLLLKWLPPRNDNGQIIGYIVYYTNDPSIRDRDWQSETIPAEKTELLLDNLKMHTLYYFKVQTRNSNRAPGTFSAMISYTINELVSLPPTQSESGGTVPNNDWSKGSGGKFNDGIRKLFNEYLIYFIAGILLITLIVSIRVVVILCMPKPGRTPEGKQKGQTELKPPDLWIHHDQMELKNIEKNPSIVESGLTSGAMTLPRPGHEFEGDVSHSHVTNSLDKRSYVPGYMTSSMTSSLERPSHYPRPYNRMHIDPGINGPPSQVQAPSIPPTPENPYSYDSMPSNYSNPSITYAPGLAIDIPKSARSQGHPLQSFTVPGPPPPNSNVSVASVRPQNASPYKKSVVTATIAPISSTNTLNNRIQQSGPTIPHSTDEIQRLAPSTSTEELNQEMATLEVLMKDLSAITASEFEC